MIMTTKKRTSKKYPQVITNHLYRGSCLRWVNIGGKNYQAQYESGEAVLFNCLPLFGTYDWLMTLPEKD